MTKTMLTTARSWRFLLLSLLICAFLIVAPLIAENMPVQILLEALLLATLFVTVSANPGWQGLRSLLFGLWVLSVLGTILSQSLTTPALWQFYRSVELLTSVPILPIIAIGVLTYVRRQQQLTVDSIFAPIAAYLMISLMFTQIYLLLLTWDPDAFVLSSTVVEGSNSHLTAEMIYFSLVTLATVGYGDILPASHPARMMAMIEAIVGQFYLAVIVALFVGIYSAKRKDGRSSHQGRSDPPPGGAGPS